MFPSLFPDGTHKGELVFIRFGVPFSVHAETTAPLFCVMISRHHHGNLSRRRVAAATGGEGKKRCLLLLLLLLPW